MQWCFLYYKAGGQAAQGFFARAARLPLLPFWLNFFAAFQHFAHPPSSLS